ncbi:MAG: ABC transporter ATP-binding protein [Ruminiclostridium sp.]|nr:ABC transporter ATP-binding protein [Ruminiclostridium sp.]
MKEILAQVKQFKKESLLAPFFTILEVIMEVILPFVMALLIDDGVSKGDIGKALLYGGIMLVVAAISLISGMLSGKYAARASTGLACNLRKSMFRNIQRFSFSNIDKFSTAGLVTRMTTDITNVQNAYQMIVRIAVRAPIMLTCSIIMCFMISPDMSIIFLIAMLFLIIALGIIMISVMKVFNVAFKKYDALNASVQENISGIRVVKSFVREDYETEKFTKASGDIYKIFKKAEGILVFNSPVMNLAIYSCMLTVCWLGASLVVNGSMEVGQLSSMFSYIMSSLMSLMMLSFIFVMLTMSVASIKRISEVLREEPDIKNPESPETMMRDGSIEFKNVHFSYHKTSEKEVLSNINLKIKSGETIGIIGGTGCGKTSLINLISRLYDVTEGTVYVGGKDVREYDLEFLRNQVSVVLQKNVLFSGTVLDNLRWGYENATEEECIAACKAACADEFIEAMPLKYNTFIERGGANVSGGQKQRLCIARALLKNPKILILDDSTSAVDTATDAKIKQAMRESIPGTTKIIIAQRISSVQDADRIIVLDDGEINGFDTHENLLKNNEIYSDIYESQVKGGGDFDRPQN